MVNHEQAISICHCVVTQRVCCALNVFVLFVDYVVCQLSEEGPCEELSGDGQLSTFNEWILPAKEFDGMWERFGLQLLFFLVVHLN